MNNEKSKNEILKTLTETDIPLQRKTDYFPSLDGWRAIAIILVLLAHWFPLGPKSLQLNFLSGVVGMSIFFALSGFLITNLLIKNDNVHDFLIRRFFRIIPLAYLYLAIVLPLTGASVGVYIANFFFYANWPPFYLDNRNSHFWSLSVEVEFYLMIALIVFLFRKRGLLIIPFLGILITGLRILHGKGTSIETYYRVDEIISGACLALVYNSQNHSLGISIQKFLKKANPYILIVLLIISSHDLSGPLMYPRPYFAALLVGTTLYQNNTKLFYILTHPILKYIATISFALYIIHPMVAYGWLDPDNTDNKIFKYFVQRPISIIILFTLAHYSTFYYEKYWISLGKKVVKQKSVG